MRRYSGFTKRSQSVQLGFSTLAFLSSQASRCSKAMSLLRSVSMLMKTEQSFLRLRKSSRVNWMPEVGLKMSTIWQTMFSKLKSRLLSMQLRRWLCSSQKYSSSQPVITPLQSRSMILNQYSMLCSVVLSYTQIMNHTKSPNPIFSSNSNFFTVCEKIRSSVFRDSVQPEYFDSSSRLSWKSWSLSSSQNLMQITQKSSQLKKSGLRLMSGSASISNRLFRMLDFLNSRKVILQSYLRLAMQNIRWITQSEYHSWNYGVSFRKSSPGCTSRISLKSCLKSPTVAYFFLASELSSQKARMCGLSFSSSFHTLLNYSLVAFTAEALPAHLCSRRAAKQLGSPSTLVTRLFAIQRVIYPLGPRVALMELRVACSATVSMGLPLGKKNWGISLVEAETS